MNSIAGHATTLRVDVAPRSSGGSFRRRGEPVALGIPLRKDVLTSADSARILDHSGRVLPVQATVSERWSDGSVRWIFLRFFATTDERGRGTYSVVVDDENGREAVTADAARVRVERVGNDIRVDTGALTAALGSEIEVRPERGGTSRLGIQVIGANGEAMDVAFALRVVEEAGLLYARVRVRGEAVSSDGRELDVSARLEFFAGLSAVRCAVAVRNPRRASHAGGIWELGDPNAVQIRGLTVRAELQEPMSRARVRYTLETADSWQSTEEELTIHQESSGGAAWSSRNHVNAAGVVPLRYRGYKVTAGTAVTHGLRPTPIVQLSGTAGAVAVTTEQFWENFPKVLRTGAQWVALDLFPCCGAELCEIQPGEQKTHRFTVLFGDESVTQFPLAWARVPLLARADPDGCLAAEPLPFLPPRGSDPAAEALIHQGIEGAHSFLMKREEVDDYGWRHFGDLFADHEAVNSDVLISHYNNQYDAIAGFAAQYLSTADDRWWSLMDDLAAHVANIDVYHTTADKSAYSGGLFWHTYHYVDAGRSTHRSYPAAPGVNGGGPSNEHNYSTGLMLHHLLTGSPESREAAIGLAEWVLAMDEGSCTPFKWLARGNTGLASCTASTAYHGPGRGAGNSIWVLLNAQRLTGERRFLDKAEALIARCIGPHDNIAELKLLDAERRWSYTVFLQAIGRYLFHKAECGELDDAYAYARASLLHYARWMAENEYPYLDQPEILEYPTETWAAQDLRKAEVFILAALCSRTTEQQHFVGRAAYFHARSIGALRQLGTSWLTRPLVILLTTCGAVPWWQLHGARTELPECALRKGGTRADFVPQRFRAMRRARLVAAACAASAFLIGAAAWCG